MKEEELRRATGAGNVCNRGSIPRRTRQWSWNHRPYPVSLVSPLVPGSPSFDLKPTRAVQRFTFLASFFASVLNLFDFSLFGSRIQFTNRRPYLSSFFLACIPFDITPFPGVAISIKAGAAVLAEVTEKPEVTLLLFSLVLEGSRLIDNQLALLILSLYPVFLLFSRYFIRSNFMTLASLIIVKFL